MEWKIENEVEYKYNCEIKNMLIKQMDRLKQNIENISKILDNLNQELQNKEKEVAEISLVLNRFEMWKTGSLLPDEIFLHIFKFLDKKTLATLYSVCVYWKNLICTHFTDMIKIQNCINCHKIYNELFNTQKSCLIGHICGSKIYTSCSRRYHCGVLGCSRKNHCGGKSYYPCEIESKKCTMKQYHLVM